MLLQVYIPLLVWLGLVVIFLIILARKYTFGKWTPENPNPYKNETLGMPRGTMRGVITLTLLILVALLEVQSLIHPEIEKVIDKLLVAFQMMLAFYFGSKAMHHVTAADERKTRQILEMMRKREAAEASQPREDDSSVG
ncbi:MAG: hypothetical protein Kow0037_00150 [Calditrichia bacterium]